MIKKIFKWLVEPTKQWSVDDMACNGYRVSWAPELFVTYGEIVEAVIVLNGGFLVA